MADISQQQQEEPPQTNGVLDGLTEEEKSKMRPADIDADMREMERRKRVEMMMNSRLFREELERIIETQMKDGSGPSGLLQQISEMMGPQGARFNTNVFKNSNCVVPINDIRGLDRMGYSKDEKLLRCKLAAVFRLLDLYGWTQGVGGMITARLNQDQQHFLVNPYGLLYHEVTASSLVKVDMQGGVVEQGTTNFGVHIANYQLHTTIHAARPDVKCIVHIATPSVTAISSMKCGLLPLGQESVVIGEVSSHHYIGSNNLDLEEREKLSRNFGPINKVMLLTNQGALCCGETVEEAFFNVYNTVLACETQLKLMPVGIENLSLLSDEAQKAIYEASRKPPVPLPSSVAERSPIAEKLQKKRWRIGGTEFEALMRMLDNAGFRTGYIYRHPLVKSEPPRPRNDVEVPPAVCSLNYLLEDTEFFRQGLWKGERKGTDRTRWLNSPNVYQKVEILETGTPDPKKITKWVSDGSPTHSSTPVKIDGALQFVPKNTNPKEFKQLQQQIKDYRRADKISAGPQSHILEGVTWEEAKKMQDATISGTGEQVVLVGAASKGIIQRGFQHNAMVYKTPYAKNPFDAVTDQELDQYKKEIERKTKGDPYDESQSESEALSSFNISRVTHESSTAKSPIQSPVSVTSETEEESRDEPKVLRIETKQVPAPSQPEVVLSDELSVKPLVLEKRVARREDIKSKSFKTHHSTGLKAVIVDFLNEQRRSEMILHRSTNKQGISGVSRFSSSRSNSCSEDLESWPGSYEACHLETARTHEVARPMKVLIKDIEKASTISRKRKREFLENSKIQLEDNNYAIVQNKTELYDVNTVSNFDTSRSKKLSIKRLPGKNLAIEISDIKFSKNTKIDFATAVDLSADCTIASNMANYKCDEETLSSPIKTEISKKNDCKKISNTLSTTDNSLNSTVEVLTDFKIEYEKNNKGEKELNLTSEFNFAEYIDVKNDTRNTNLYVNEVEFSICNGCEKLDGNNLERHSFNGIYGNSLEILDNRVQNDTEKCVKKNSNNRDTEEVINYINEVEFFVDNDSNCCDNEIVNKNAAHDSSKMSIDNVMENNTDNETAKCITKINKISDETQEENKIAHKNSHSNNYSTSVDVDSIKMNPLGVNLSLFLKNGTEICTLNESFDDTDTTIKAFEKSNNSVDMDNKQYSDKNGNVWPSVHKDDISSLNDNMEHLPKIISNSLDFTYSEIDKHSEDFNSASTTRESFFTDDDLVMKRITRRDSIAEVASSINADIKPSNKVIVDMLADTENSIKYNLDSQNMSLIYSITPTNDISDSSKNTTIEDILEDIQDDYVYKENDIDKTELIRMNSLHSVEKKDVPNMNNTIELSETSFASNISNQGSDLLELPSHTYLDLQKSSDEIFQKNMSSSVNQIINELNDAELFVNAANFVDEIMYDVACLNLQYDITKFSKLELKNHIQAKIWALNLTKKIAKDLVGNLQCYDADKSTNSKVSNNEESDQVESLDQSVYVIREVIHHLVDKESLGKCDFKNKKTITNKKAKESINIELKSLNDDYIIGNEIKIKCSTPFSLTPNRSKNNSFSEDDTVLDADNNDESPLTHEKNTSISLDEQQVSNLPISSNSSPSTESQNFAEQEVTSESTDNDTKSDNSKEKKTSLGKETLILRKQSIYSIPDNSPIATDSLRVMACDGDNEPKQLDVALNKMSYCVIECASERSECLETTPDDKMNSEISPDFSMSTTHDPNNEPKQLDVIPNQMSYCVIESISEHDGYLEDNSNNQMNSDISFNSSRISTYHQTDISKQLDVVSNKMNYCVLEYASEKNMICDNISIIKCENVHDIETDSNETIADFMEKYMDCEEEINQLWSLSEEKLEEMYAAERLDEIINIKEDTAVLCNENIPTDEVKDISFIFPDIKNDFTSDTYNDNYYDDRIKIEKQFEIHDECYQNLDSFGTANNAINTNLRIKTEKLELNNTNDLTSMKATLESRNSYSKLPPISELPELNSSSDEFIEYPNETESTELHCCQNSLSLKSLCNQETMNSTYSLPTVPFSDCEKAYNADISTNEASSDSSSVSSVLDSTIWEMMKANNNNCRGDVTENFADVSNNSSVNNNCDVATLEYMTYSYDTKEFIQMEMACKKNGEFFDVT